MPLTPWVRGKILVLECSNLHNLVGQGTKGNLLRVMTGERGTHCRDLKDDLVTTLEQFGLGETLPSGLKKNKAHLNSLHITLFMLISEMKILEGQRKKITDKPPPQESTHIFTYFCAVFLHTHVIFTVLGSVICLYGRRVLDLGLVSQGSLIHSYGCRCSPQTLSFHSFIQQIFMKPHVQGWVLRPLDKTHILVEGETVHE